MLLDVLLEMGECSVSSSQTESYGLIWSYIYSHPLRFVDRRIKRLLD